MLFLITNYQKNLLDYVCCEHHTFYRASDILKQFRYPFPGMAGCAISTSSVTDRKHMKVAVKVQHNNSNAYLSLSFAFLGH